MVPSSISGESFPASLKRTGADFYPATEDETITVKFEAHFVLSILGHFFAWSFRFCSLLLIPVVAPFIYTWHSAIHSPMLLSQNLVLKPYHFGLQEPLTPGSLVGKQRCWLSSKACAGFRTRRPGCHGFYTLPRATFEKIPGDALWLVHSLKEQVNGSGTWLFCWITSCLFLIKKNGKKTWVRVFHNVWVIILVRTDIIQSSLPLIFTAHERYYTMWNSKSQYNKQRLNLLIC